MKQSRQKHSATFKAKLAALKGGLANWPASMAEPDPCLEEGAARRRVFESGSDREDKTNEIQVGELYRQIGQLKVENDFLARRLGK
jgi:transposase